MAVGCVGGDAHTAQRGRAARWLGGVDMTPRPTDERP